MNCRFVLRCGAMAGAVAAAGLFALLPARAQMPAASLAAMVATPPGAATSAPSAPKCVIRHGQVRLDFPLPHTARKIAAGEPITIVALGSSSTAGAGASSSAAAYPSRLA